MNRSGVSNISGALFMTYLFAFLLISGWALLFPAYRVTSSEFLGTSLLQAVRFFFDNLIPINSTAILIAYSVLYTRDPRRMEKTAHAFTRVVSPVVVLLVVLTMGYMAGIIWLKPLVEKKIEENIASASIARNFLEKAKQAYLDKDYAKASSYVTFSLTADPNGKEAQALERTVRRYIIEQTERPQKEPVEKPAFVHEEFMEEQNADTLMEKAMYFYKNENYYSAYYFASLAQKLDPRRTDARRVSVDALNKLRSSELGANDLEERAFYKRKHEGYEALLNRDYINAYYIFSELAKKQPNDRDLNEYLKKSVRFVRLLSFFTDEIKDIDAYPGIGNILFVNRETAESTEFVLIGKMVQLTEGIYFRNIESMIVSNRGEIVSHMKSDYGKYIFAGDNDTSSESGDSKVEELRAAKAGTKSRDYINLSAIDRNSPDLKTFPVYYVGGRATDIFDHFIPLVPSVSDLKHYRATGRFVSTSNWIELLAHRLSGNLEKRGIATFEIDCLLLANAILPFAFLAFAIFSISMGWVFRARYAANPPLALLLLSPIIPFVIAFLSNLYLYMSKAIAGLVLMMGGFFIALIAVCVVQGIIIVVAFILIAGKFAE